MAVKLAQLILNDPHVLAQIVLTLALVNILLNRALDFVFQLQYLKLVLQRNTEALQSRQRVYCAQALLAFPHFQIGHRSHDVG